MKTFFIFDAESIGLHGEVFAVAGGVYLENGAALSEFGYACNPQLALGDDGDRKWVMENVPLIPQTHQSPKPLRDAFWMEWKRAKARCPGIVMAVECGWPVEARFLSACIDDDPTRKWEGPYPLMEIASYMQAAGMDPMGAYERTPSELPKHNPTADARQSARLLSEALALLSSR